MTFALGGVFGEGVVDFAKNVEESVKNLFSPGMLFEELGFRYFGPIDGHDLPKLCDTLRFVRGMSGPRVIHVITQKGKGFAFAESNQEKWHGLAAYDPVTGEARKKASGPPTWTQVFGDGLTALAAEHPELVAITAAMPSGTGTNIFQKKHPERFFDVGIAEGHAVTFAGGLATQGIRPVVAIYSTFLQRAYDNIIHDVAMQQLPVMFCMDRAGLVGEDGQTHMGLYDIAYMLAVPGMTVTAPKDGDELIGLLRTALAHTGGPFCTRYPRDKAPARAAPRVRDPGRAVRHLGAAPVRQGRRHPRRRHDGAAGAAGGRAARRRRHRLRRRQLPLPQAARPRDAGAAAAGAPHAGDGRGGHDRERLRRLPGRDAADDASRSAGRRPRRARPADRAGAAHRAARGVRAHRRRDRPPDHRAAARGEPRGAMKVGVVGNPRYRDLRAVLEHVARQAPYKQITLYSEERLASFWPRDIPPFDGVELDALVTFGGDGTLLRGARLCGGREIPILGVNLGRVGFLTTATRDTLDPALDALVAGRYVIERRQALQAAIKDFEGNHRVSQLAVNDVAVHKGGVARVVRVNVFIQGENVGPYSADGIIVATPTGSTAYSLSAGGPIVVPGVEAIIVTPIAAHTLAVRPLVVPATYRIVIEPMAGWADDLLVSFDGQTGSTLAPGESVDVRRADHRVCLIRLGGDGFFSRMRQKLHWGDLSEREAVR